MLVRCSSTILLFLTVKSRAYSKPLYSPPERTVVLLYHKPINVVTTHAANDVKGRMNVYDDVLSMKGFSGWNHVGKSADRERTPASFAEATQIRSKLHAIGRLDAETTGLLLLTNDGGLVHHVTNKDSVSHQHHGNPVFKTYEALVMGFYDNHSPLLEKMRTQGVNIGDKYGGTTRPVDELIVKTNPTLKSTLVSLTICEGKNRQIRRMFHALGSGVIRLCRTQIGRSLTLSSVPMAGQWRILTEKEVETALDWRPRYIGEVSALSRAGKTTKAVTGTSRRRKRSNF
ncbi:predicted protein [Phaeodactylum tricornutum CCAP 1055/1]|jgi:pseudouridine synthase|uniref:Pseudouridine synthase RsuA/RluA-like domain-containing protein n=2 Tax=Phaeodactylum tricornutum TaxID=2850 RepID=B7G1Y5_PHATC|nr:predicted protein [Phaeodactylum tricornutum CCAP 1055/1]XP_002181284.1 predicted protein [Phaeodactylum tricornutum CCAP 1055/1]EEC42877.1 predicted protein [Phaeodactylum tricornutum CCAP 1055/1]EEC47207.1 predicted protein [Phaeodactylum tricornutum CCAP 1055/1]|eukprot:XP_002176126.1 predicted protein [Phaeodactylum tricornutum CCAP 1055/1]